MRPEKIRSRYVCFKCLANRFGPLHIRTGGDACGKKERLFVSYFMQSTLSRYPVTASRSSRLLDHCLRDGVVEIVLLGAAACLHEEDRNHLFLAVHPPIRAVVTVPAVAAVRLSHARFSAI